MKNTFKFIVSSVLILFYLAGLFSSVIAQETKILSSQEKNDVIDSIAKLMEEKYVFPDVGKTIGDKVKDNLQKGNYDKITDYRKFASKVTEDLRSINNDRHIGLRYAPEYIAMAKKAEADSNNRELEDFEKRMDEFSNYNFKEIRILPGNVGYLKFNSFMDAAIAGPTAVAAMNFLAHTGALIIDLTDNGGGNPSMIQLISSYFFKEPEHLNSFYIREGDKTDQFWTLPYVPGPKMVNTDLYVLTSNYTFSGAEEFTYDLKNMKRATIVGETTGGGAHPVDRFIIDDNFGITIPFGRAINPITKTNWEGTGVEPDIKTAKEKALDVAYEMAVEKELKNETNENLKTQLAWVLEGLKTKNNPITLDPKLAKTYVGTYGPRKITFENGELFYQREDRPKMKMIPMSEDMFRFEDIDYFRLKMILENGKVVAVEGHYDNGNTDRNDKD